MLSPPSIHKLCLHWNWKIDALFRPLYFSPDFQIANCIDYLYTLQRNKYDEWAVFYKNILAPRLLEQKMIHYLVTLARWFLDWNASATQVAWDVRLASQNLIFWNDFKITGVRNRIRDECNWSQNNIYPVYLSFLSACSFSLSSCQVSPSVCLPAHADKTFYLSLVS